MAIDAAADVSSLDADVVRLGAAVSPPFRWPKDPHDRCSGSDREMRRSGIAADVYHRIFGEFVETFERRLHGDGLSHTACGKNTIRQYRFAWPRRHNRNNAEFVPDHIRKLAVLFGVPQLCYPAARRIEDRKSSAGTLDQRGGLGSAFLVSEDREFDRPRNAANAESRPGKCQVLQNDMRSRRNADNIGQEEPRGRFPKPAFRKTPASLRSGKLRDRRRFYKPLQIDRNVEPVLPEPADLAADVEQNFFDHLAAAERAGIDLDQIIDQFISAEDFRGSRFRDPRYFGIRKMPPRLGKRRQRVDDIANGGKLYKKNMHEPVYVTYACRLRPELAPRPTAKHIEKFLWQKPASLSYPISWGLRTPACPDFFMHDADSDLRDLRWRLPTVAYNVPMARPEGQLRDIRPALVFLSGELIAVPIPLEREEVTMGRAFEADVRVNDSKVSRIHAKIVTVGDPEAGNARHVLTDCESRNGTFVNGERITEHVLHNGDKITIGEHILRFDLLDEIDREYQRQIHRLISHDDLTGLLSSRSFFSELRREAARAKAQNRRFCVLMMDVDHFKNVNDNYGHLTGSRTLEEIGACIVGVMRSGDAASRFGGEEFSAFLLDADLPQAMVAAERIRSVVESRDFTVIRHGNPGETHHVTISIGIAQFPDDTSDPIELVEMADSALYRAKREGRNRVCAYRRLSAEELARDLPARTD